MLHNSIIDHEVKVLYDSSALEVLDINNKKLKVKGRTCITICESLVKICEDEGV